MTDLWRFDSWDFTPEPASLDDLVTCPSDREADGWGRGCGVASPLKNWTISTVSCGDCGEHEALECPGCQTPWDHVWTPTFVVTPAAGQLSGR